MEVLFAVASRIVPEIASLDASSRQAFQDIVGDALMQRDAGIRRQFRLFLVVISMLGVVRYGTPFTRLSGARQDAVLRWLQEAPAQRLAAGFWGLKTIVFMGYYAQDAVASKVAYTPSLTGNDMLHA